MPALVNDLAVGVAVPEAGGVMSCALILAMCEVKPLTDVVFRTIGNKEFRLQFPWVCRISV
jgi:hypothetical protein